MIQKMTSPTDPTLILQVGTQAICNMLTNNSTDIATVWHAWLTEPERGMLWSYVLSKSDDGLIMSALVLIINCIRGHQQRCDLFVSSKSGQDMLSAILGDMERLHDNQDSKNFELGYTVLSELFSFGHFKTLFIQVDDYSHKIPLSDHQIILLKCLDAKIHSTDEFPPCISTHELTLLSQTLAHIGTLQITNKNEDLVQPIYTGIILILEILNALFVLDQPRVKAYLVQVNAVTLMIDLLRFMETIELTTTDQPKVGFDFLKRECVRLLGTLCYKDKEIQDKIRTLGGIPLILSQLKIDDSNPYIKEYAVLAIRHLLENNTENQQFIQELEPQQVIQTKELTEMGIQPELKEGKISIRRS
ncbi:hypothetical protein CU098_002950 [Rhizopus stolonifer]|uniref:Ataxin-10 homolog n=1 Tax=Rhizopus stolonifer TaxID=4846 RepID=A0A367KJ48_RHIST|nr:hypothetical protein CU098_002950 [Rhizopus stolonifer]